ncbi:MAG: Glu-tRNA(Gln) amidotransferase subunit GatD [Candidatus Nanohaloarchaea archaeon]
MYSGRVQDVLEENDIEIGDRIKVKNREGRLMPKPESGDQDTIILKLDSGYNIGLKPENIELVEKNDTEGREKAEVPRSDDKKDVLVLHTGGTIASRVSYEEGGVKPAFDPEDLIEMYPELTEVCNVHSEVIAQMLSEDMEPGHWQDIARKVDEVKDDYDGIIIGHGTDTMSFTGAALSFMLQGIDTGVIMVGSQRSSDRPSSDAAVNLYSAVKFLTDTEFEGIGVCMHHSSDDRVCDIMPAHKVRKMHTSRRDAFKPINTEVLGTVNYQTGEIEENFDKNDRDYEPKFELDTKVGMLKVRPGLKARDIEYFIENDYDGVIVEGTGLGHMPVNSFDDKTEHHDDILEKVGELSEKATVVMTSNCINGRVDMNVYDAGLKIQEAGVVPGEDMHPELAYVKLMWVLANTDDPEEMMGVDLCGEIEDRTIYDDEAETR